MNRIRQGKPSKGNSQSCTNLGGSISKFKDHGKGTTFACLVKARPWGQSV
jgi:hypothetical protein